ncbi:MAG: hypothetical protein WCE68_05825 [Anaerolineales bacterium]
MRERIAGLSKSPNAGQVLDALFMAPVIRTPNFIKLTGLKPQTAHRIIALLKEEKILSSLVKPSGRTPEILAFEALFTLIR